MNTTNCFYLNTWPWGTNLRVKAHIVDELNHIKATVLYVHASKEALPENMSLPIMIIRNYSNIIEAKTIFNSREQVIKIEVDKFLSREALNERAH